MTEIVDHGRTRAGVTQLRRHWQAAQPRVAMLVVHGIDEHSGRYARFAEVLNEAGIDVIAIDLSPLHQVPSSSPWSIVAYAAKACDVRHVAVDGNLVVRDRTLQTLDIKTVRDRAIRAAARLFP